MRPNLIPSVRRMRPTDAGNTSKSDPELAGGQPRRPFFASFVQPGPNRRRALIGWLPFAIGLMVVVAVGILTARQVLVNQRHNERVEHTLTVIMVATSLEGALTEANSTQRGLLLTAHPAFRTRYEDARLRTRALLQQLQELVADNPAQQARLARLAPLLRARMAEFERVDALIRDGDLAGGGRRALIAMEQTTDVRNMLGMVTAAERGLLAKRRAAAERSGDALMALSVGGLTIAALLVGLSIAALRRRAAELERAGSDVQLLNDELESRVASRTAALGEANEEIRRFAYIVSHDLRSPLVNIMGFTAELAVVQKQAAAVLEREGNVAEAAERQAILVDMPEALGFIRASTVRMDRLIKAILNLSRLGRRALTPEDIDLGALFASLAVTLRSQMEATDTELEMDPLPPIRSDRLALEQLFGNLLDNAIKYLRPDVPGRLHVSARSLGPSIEVTVADNGRGIAAADQDRVFELFRRAGSQDRAGDGVGLAHVRALVRRLGGRIRLESRLGEGSRFLVELPRDIGNSPVTIENGDGDEQ